jgi:hypothetical protein
MKMYMGSGSIITPFLTSVQIEVSNQLHLLCIIPGKQTLYPLQRRLGRFHSPYECYQEAKTFLYEPGFEPLIPQPSSL